MVWGVVALSCSRPRFRGRLGVAVRCGWLQCGQEWLVWHLLLNERFSRTPDEPLTSHTRTAPPQRSRTPTHELAKRVFGLGIASHTSQTSSSPVRTSSGGGAVNRGSCGTCSTERERFSHVTANHEPFSNRTATTGLPNRLAHVRSLAHQESSALPSHCFAHVRSLSKTPKDSLRSSFEPFVRYRSRRPRASRRAPGTQVRIATKTTDY